MISGIAFVLCLLCKVDFSYTTTASTLSGGFYLHEQLTINQYLEFILKTNYPQYKTAFAVIATTVLLTACGKQIDYREVETQRGLVYRAHETTPFTGTIKNEQWSTALPTATYGTCTDEFKDGLRDGKRICSSMKGVKLEESEWREGKRHGVEKRWELTTGKFWKLTHYENDQKNGLEEVHNPFENEALISSLNWVDGKKSGNEKIWDLTGKILRTDLNWVDGKKNGVVRFGVMLETYKDNILNGRHIIYVTPADQQMAFNKLNNQILEISHQQELLEGGSSFAGDLPGMIVSIDEELVNGIHKPAPALQTCVNDKEAAYKADPMSFQYGMVTSSNIIQWEKECAAGKTTPVSAQAQAAGNSVGACLDAKIAATRKISPDEPISQDVLDEWEKDCKTGK
ncbi:toxin-antitoxin system YwqK family antitoxin [Undibacterium griseum]|uniref:Lipoprotein n=1 Tax=Undibacterium griseum TaxID=2762295 RepID=A0ABR6YJL2_9BURK|nr:hypothetical protein [Undibacterium griseum]MBC3884054.1 hypothetical protein [Undibacterium griseum]